VRFVRWRRQRIKQQIMIRLPDDQPLRRDQPISLYRIRAPTF